MTTKDLLIVSLYQHKGLSPTAIALKLNCSATTIRNKLKSPDYIAYMAEQKEVTDQYIEGLYQNCAVAIKNGLDNENPMISLKAAELGLKVLGKLKPTEHDGNKDRTNVTIEKILNIVGAPPTKQELKDIDRYYIADGQKTANPSQKAIQGTASNSE